MTITKDTKECVERIEWAINSTAVYPDSVANAIVNGIGYESGMHRSNQDKFFKICLGTIFELAKCYETGRYDARNESACRQANKIAQMIRNDGQEYYNNPDMWAISHHYDDVFAEREQLRSEVENG